jgi:hypothetical protein
MKKITKTILFLILFFPLATFAFPNDAKTAMVAPTSGTSGTFLASVSNPRTILAIYQICEQANNNYIRIGTSGTNYLLASNKNSIVEKEISFVVGASTPIDWVKQTAGDKCNFTIVYTDYDLSLVGTGTGSVVVDPTTFTYGDLMISLLLFILLIFALVAFLRGAISSVAVSRKYQGNNSPDGKEFYDI